MAAACAPTPMSSWNSSTSRSSPSGCASRWKTPEAMLDYLKSRGCRVGGVTLGEKGLLWYDETGAVRALPALPIPPDRVLDTNGAGDVFHGAYIFSYLNNPGKSWQDPFEFGRAA